MSEIWRSVNGWPYEVSDAGRVRRSIAALGRTQIGRKLRPYVLQRGGYLGITLRDGGGRVKYARLHVLVAEAYLGPRPAGKQVNHKNGHKADNRVCNLEWLTPADNAKHAVTMGLVPRGDRHWMIRRQIRGENAPGSKLTDTQRAAIVAEYGGGKGGIRQIDIANKYGVTQVRVSQIVRRWPE